MQIKTISDISLNQPKIAIYTRNTVFEQPVEYRLHQDVHVLRDKYKKEGYEISKIYCEPSSTSDKKKRPALQKLLEDAANGLFDVVLVWDIFTLSSNGEELQLIERELARHDVELCSATEAFDLTTEEGRKVFEYMCKLLDTNHLSLSALQGIPLSQVARWFLEDESMKGGSEYANLCK